MARCAIYGVGSLGTVLGAYTTKNGGDIVHINRNAAHVQVPNEKGAHITGTVEMPVPVKAITPDQMESKYDIILLMTKQLLINVTFSGLGTVAGGTFGSVFENAAGMEFTPV